MVLALAAFAMLAWALVSHVEERGGKKSGASLPLPSGDPQPATTAQMPLVPGSVVVPVPSTPKDPLPPLQPSPATSGSSAGPGKRR
jgi:hypothetical protein